MFINLASCSTVETVEQLEKSKSEVRKGFYKRPQSKSGYFDLM